MIDKLDIEEIKPQVEDILQLFSNKKEKQVINFKC